MNTSDINDTLFLRAVEAIDRGDISALQQLLEENPDLATKRLSTPNEEGYFANPFLLWFVADNPIRHEKIKPNIVDIAKLIIDVLQTQKHPKYQYIVDYTLGLVATGRIPKECEVQIPLMELLIDKGARPKGSVLGPIGQHNFEAAKYLLNKGSDYDLATAVGLNRIEDIKGLAKNATPSELYVALVVASFFGKDDFIALLIEAGADVNGSGNKKDFGGFHSHASALHQAVYSGSLTAVKLLVNSGANLNAKDKAYNGTPLGWAIYMQTEATNETEKKKFRAIESYLSSKQEE